MDSDPETKKKKIFRSVSGKLNRKIHHHVSSPEDALLKSKVKVNLKNDESGFNTFQNASVSSPKCLSRNLSFGSTQFEGKEFSLFFFSSLFLFFLFLPLLFFFLLTPKISYKRTRRRIRRGPKVYNMYQRCQSNHFSLRKEQFRAYKEYLSSQYNFIKDKTVEDPIV